MLLAMPHLSFYLSFSPTCPLAYVLPKHTIGTRCLTLCAADVINGQRGKVPRVAVLTVLSELDAVSGCTGEAEAGYGEFFQENFYAPDEAVPVLRSGMG